MIPTLTCGGAQLRSWTVADAARLVDGWADADVAQWNSVPPEPTLAAAARWINGVDERSSQRLSFDWVIDRGDEGGVVGEVGLSGFSERHDGALIGYWLLPQARGLGLATRAVSAVTAWAHEALDLGVIVARCHDANSASQRVAKAAGFILERSDSTGHQLWISRP